MSEEGAMSAPHRFIHDHLLLLKQLSYGRLGWSLILLFKLIYQVYQIR